MIAVLPGLLNILRSDSILTSMLSTYGSDPAVFLSLAPSAAQMPYAVVRAESRVPEEGHATERMVYAVDVFDYSESALRALQIAQRIELLLDRRRLEISGQTGLAVFRDFAALVPEDDPAIQHVHLAFIVRYGREDLIDN